MGAATSSTGLVESVAKGDIERLKSILRSHKAHVADLTEAATDSTWELELEEAVHTVVASDIKSERHLQQQQFALELLLLTRPDAWSAVTSFQKLREYSEAIRNWTPSHQACATGNLAFVAFVLQHYPAQFEIQSRDAFGLFPIDVVPPEVLINAEMSANDVQKEHHAMDFTTSCTRQCLVFNRLRERKAKLQNEHVRRLVSTSPVEPRGKQEETIGRASDFYIALEPRRKYLSHNQAYNSGHVHERGKTLRVRYRLPRRDPFLNGYFQLIWRETGDARSEEPNYDPRVTRLSDECARLLDEEASLPPYHGLTARSFVLPDDKHVVDGSFPLDITHLPTHSVCNVLFITCDRRQLHRTVALSTEGLAIQAMKCDGNEYYSDSTSEGELTDNEISKRQHQDHAKLQEYTFFVGGEQFSHPHSVFAGQSFPNVEVFEEFLRDLRVKK